MQSHVNVLEGATHTELLKIVILTILFFKEKCWLQYFRDSIILKKLVGCIFSVDLKKNYSVKLSDRWYFPTSWLNPESFLSLQTCAQREIKCHVIPALPSSDTWTRKHQCWCSWWCLSTWKRMLCILQDLESLHLALSFTQPLEKIAPGSHL